MEINIVKDIVKNETVDMVELKQNLANYIMSVQSLVDRVHIMEKEKNINFEHLNKRIEVLENYEDKLLLELGGIK